MAANLQRAAISWPVTRNHSCLESTMMLRITGVREVSNGTLTIDELVPFTFRAHEGVLPNPYYWLIGNFKTSLLEIKVDRQTTAVSAVILTLFNERVGLGVPSAYKDISCQPGLPLVETEKFVQGRYNQDCNFRLVREENLFVAILREGVPPQRCLSVDRVRFCTTGNELCAIAFSGLSSEELERLHNLHGG
jgi:hypothetical protein